MTTAAGRGLFVDTNVLVYATDLLSPWHVAATRTLIAARRADEQLVISTRVVREYLSVLTRNRVQTGVPPWEQMLDNVRIFLVEFQVVPETIAVARALAGLVEQYSVSGKQVYDANIVATMRVHGIARLLTHNGADFARFGPLVSVQPL